MSLRRYAGYVEQVETLLETLTATEMLFYSRTISKKDYDEFLQLGICKRLIEERFNEKDEKWMNSFTNSISTKSNITRSAIG